MVERGMQAMQAMEIEAGKSEKEQGKRAQHSLLSVDDEEPTEGQQPYNNRDLELPPPPSSWYWQLMAVDVAGMGLLLGLGFAFSDKAAPLDRPIGLERPDIVLFATGLFSLLFLPLTWWPWISAECYTLHLHLLGFAFCALIHIGIPLEHDPLSSPGLSRSGIRTVEDSLVHMPLLLFTIPLLYHYGAKHTLARHSELPQNRADLDCLGSADTKAFVNNYVFYFLPFLAGIFPNLLQKLGMLPDFALTDQGKGKASSWPVGFVLMVAIAGSAVAYLFKHHVFQSHAAGTLLTFTLPYICSIFTFLILGICLHDNGYRVHLHHYFTMAMLVPLTQHAGRVSMVYQAFLAGAQLQGISVWGPSPVFFVLAHRGNSTCTPN